MTPEEASFRSSSTKVEGVQLAEQNMHLIWESSSGTPCSPGSKFSTRVWEASGSALWRPGRAQVQGSALRTLRVVWSPSVPPHVLPCSCLHSSHGSLVSILRRADAPAGSSKW